MTDSNRQIDQFYAGLALQAVDRCGAVAAVGGTKSLRVKFSGFRKFRTLRLACKAFKADMQGGHPRYSHSRRMCRLTVLPWPMSTGCTVDMRHSGGCGCGRGASGMRRLVTVSVHRRAPIGGARARQKPELCVPDAIRTATYETWRTTY